MKVPVSACQTESVKVPLSACQTESVKVPVSACQTESVKVPFLQICSNKVQDFWHTRDPGARC